MPRWVGFRRISGWCAAGAGSAGAADRAVVRACASRELASRRRRAVHFAGAGGHHAALTQVSRQAPAQNPGDADDYCAICASIFLASTSFASQPPPLPVPAGFQRIAHSIGRRSGIDRAAARRLPVPRPACRLTFGRCRASALPRLPFLRRRCSQDRTRHFLHILTMPRQHDR